MSKENDSLANIPKSVKLHIVKMNIEITIFKHKFQTTKQIKDESFIRYKRQPSNALNGSPKKLAIRKSQNHF